MVSSFAMADAAREAVEAIRHRRLRSTLLGLSTAVGIGAFVAAFAFGATTRAEVQAQFDALRPTEVTIRPRDSSLFGGFNDRSIALLSQVPGVMDVGIIGSVNLGPTGTVVGRWGEMEEGPTPVVAMSPGGLRAVEPILAQGRLIDDFQEGRAERVALVGSAAAARLGVNRADASQAIFLNDVPFVVVGVIESVDRRQDLVDAVVIPVSAAKVDFSEDMSEADVLIHVEAGAAEQVARRATRLLSPEKPDDVVAVVAVTPADLQLAVGRNLQGVFQAVGALALLVGIVLISVVSASGVVERRMEIGLRRALGARSSDISLQMVLESITIGLVASVAGTAVAVVAMYFWAFGNGFDLKLPVYITYVGPFVGVIAGMLGGVMPALKASRVPAAVSLRT